MSLAIAPAARSAARPARFNPDAFDAFAAQIGSHELSPDALMLAYAAAPRALPTATPSAPKRKLFSRILRK